MSGRAPTGALPRLPLAAATLLLLAWAGGIAAAAEPSPPSAEAELRGFLEEAQALFQRASNTTDPAAAAVLYRQALDRFVSVAEEGGVRNAGLYYNIGNVHYRLGEMGKAILYYRRAELLNPADRNLRHNLRFVRSQRVDRLPPGQLSRIARILFFWHYWLSPAARVILFAAVFATACLVGALAALRRVGALAALRGALRGGKAKTAAGALPRRQDPVPRVAWAAGALALLLLVSMLAGEVRLRTLRDGVIVAEEVVVRKGDGIAYQPSFVDPLHQGTEFVLLEDRAGWYHVRLADGRSGWLPASAAEMVLEGG